MRPVVKWGGYGFFAIWFGVLFWLFSVYMLKPSGPWIKVALGVLSMVSMFALHVFWEHARKDRQGENLTT